MPAVELGDGLIVLTCVAQLTPSSNVLVMAAFLAWASFGGRCTRHGERQVRFLRGGRTPTVRVADPTLCPFQR